MIFILFMILTLVVCYLYEISRKKVVDKKILENYKNFILLNPGDIIVDYDGTCYTNKVKLFKLHESVNFICAKLIYKARLDRKMIAINIHTNYIANFSEIFNNIMVTDIDIY
jgi:hypothetical protein